MGILVLGLLIPKVVNQYLYTDCHYLYHHMYYITIIMDLIGCKNVIDYKNFMDDARLISQKAAVEVIISLDIRLFDIKTFVAKSLIWGSVDVNGENMHTEITLIGLGILVL